jgi:hypothetical protein
MLIPPWISAAGDDYAHSASYAAGRNLCGFSGLKGAFREINAEKQRDTKK